MRILCTFPGRAGDIFWALPTVRALSEWTGAPVDLLIAGEFSGMIPLLNAGAPYLGYIFAAPEWGLTPPEAWNPPADAVASRDILLGGYDRIYHLGYRGWPKHPLPFDVEANLHQQWRDADGDHLHVDLARPWLELPGYTGTHPRPLVYGFSDCWFELKVGVVNLLSTQLIRRFVTDEDRPFPAYHVVCPHGSRWEREGGWPGTSWLEAAEIIAQCQVFCGCCSALHVLAIALGKPVVVLEPMEARWNPIFYPLGTGMGVFAGSELGRSLPAAPVHLVCGLDGEPTFDARHVAEAIHGAFARLPQEPIR